MVLPFSVGCRTSDSPNLSAVSQRSHLLRWANIWPGENVVSYILGQDLSTRSWLSLNSHRDWGVVSVLILLLTSFYFILSTKFPPEFSAECVCFISYHKTLHSFMMNSCYSVKWVDGGLPGISASVHTVNVLEAMLLFGLLGEGGQRT